MQITSTDSGLQLIFLNSFGRFGNGISVFPTLRMFRSWSKFNGRFESCKQFTMYAIYITNVEWNFQFRFDFGSVFFYKKLHFGFGSCKSSIQNLKNISYFNFLPNSAHSAQCGIIMLLSVHPSLHL